MATIKNRFEIIRKLGEGSTGEVFLGKDTRSGKHVAIKQLLPDLDESRKAGLLTRLEREGRALQDLDHPNIVRLLDILEEEERHYVLMEYQHAGSLHQKLRKEQRLTVHEVLRLGEDIADALAHAHHLGILHGALKPANILIADDGRALLADFAMADLYQTDDSLYRGLPSGTLPYLSPEGCHGQPLDARADIWSFGVVLFEMLTGQLPFEGHQPAMQMAAILTRPTPDIEVLRPDTPVGLADLVHRMLAKDRARRIPNAQIVGAELEAMLHGQTMNGTPNGRVRTMTALLSSERFTPPPASDHFRRHNLPAPTAACIGREDEFDAVRQLLNEPDIRLVTLLGPGGIGKTRLALELGQQLVNERGALGTNANVASSSRTVETSYAFMDGVLFVPLAPIRQPTSLLQAIADGIGFRFQQRIDPTQQLIDFFRDKTLLLILDNCEHLLREFRLITRLMDAAPGLKVLATSRERLGLPAELVFALEGMDVPDWWSTEEALQMSAMQLFEQAATRIRPAFRLGPDDLLPVARICQMVQGMPLGLELAAAWVDALTPAEIADRLGLTLNLMQSSLPRERERHHSMRAVFDMSWERLNSSEREAFMRLSVFAGGFTRDMAATIARANLRTLISLTEKALLQRQPDGRFVMHELLQQYAAERLALSDEHDALFDRHSNIFLEFVRVHEPALHGRGQLRALETIRAEVHNIRSAWNWALSQKKTDLIGAALRATHLFCEIGGYERAGVAAFQDATQALKMERLQGHSGLVIARLLAHMAHLMTPLSPQDAEGMRDEALQALQELSAPAEELAFLYTTWAGIPEQVQERREEGLALYRQLDDPPGQVRALLNLGSFYHRQREDYDRAFALLQSCLTLAQQIGNTYFEGLARFQLGWLNRDLGHLADALTHYQAALAILARFKRHRLEADTYHNMSLIAIEQGDTARAEEYIRQSLAIHREIGNRFNIFAALDTLGTLKYNLGQYGAALKYYYEARDVVTELENPHSSAFISKQLGFVYLAMGEARTARMHFVNALRQGIYYAIPGVMVDSLVGTAILLANEGQRERALELLAVTADHSASGKHEADEQRLVDELHEEFSDDVFYGVWQIGQAQEMEMVITELLAELEGEE